MAARDAQQQSCPPPCPPPCPPSCAIQRTFSRCRSSPVVCREPLFLVQLARYAKDPGFRLFFPQAVHATDNLYDATVTDGDCRVRVTLEPSLNRLVETNVLRCGCQLKNVSFAPGVSARDGPGDRTYRVTGLEVVPGGRGAPAGGLPQAEALPWFGEAAGRAAGAGPCLLPLRAGRRCYLPLWNNTDYCGEAWRDTPPSHTGTREEEEEEEEQEEEEEVKATVTVRDLREAFFSRSCGARGGARAKGGARGGARARGGASGVLLVRVLNKSRVVHYGKADTNCECPYKAVLQVCDVSGSVCVVLWNTVCLDWYRCLRPGQILRLARYRVKESFQHRTDDNAEPDIEVSLNSRNPAAEITILPESSVSPDCRPPNISYTFCCGKELLDCLHGSLCDVIGLVVFAGRPERTGSKDSRGAELFEYRWLLLEDGTTHQPIVVQLFATSQPETHANIHPLSVVVATRMKVIRTPDSTHLHLTSTTFTQVYCTGSGHHSAMPYRKLRPVRQFIQWLQSLDDSQVLSRAVVGGYFSYPPPPVSLETYMRSKKGDLVLLGGAEVQMELKSLRYRERCSLCIQATITMVTHCRRGEEQQSLVWTDRRSPFPSSSSSSSHPSFSSARSPLSPLRVSPSSPPTSSTSLNASLPHSPLRFSPISSRLSPTIPRPLPSSPCSSRLPPSSPTIPRPLPSSPCSSRLPPSSPTIPRPLPSSPCSSRLPPSSPTIPRPLPSSPCSSRLPPSSPCSSARLSPSSPGSPVKLSPRLQVLTAGSILGSGRSPKRRLFQSVDPPRKKRLTLSALQHDQDEDTGTLWSASMEFLEQNDEEDDDEDEEDDDDSFLTAPSSPGSAPSWRAAPRVAVETIPLQYRHDRREAQAVAVAMQLAELRKVPPAAGVTMETLDPAHSYTGHYTLRLRALTDGASLDVVFLPNPPGSPLCPPQTHANHWTAILQHGGFSPHTHPPEPADLIATATQLANQRLVCVLEACSLGGDGVNNTELILTRAFPLRD